MQYQSVGEPVGAAGQRPIIVAAPRYVTAPPAAQPASRYVQSGYHTAATTQAAPVYITQGQTVVQQPTARVVQAGTTATRVVGRTSIGASTASVAQRSTASSKSAWQQDKGAFKQWVKVAVEVQGSAENNQLYGFLTECFMDADGDRDGLVNQSEFDFLVEKAASLPRRFGLAPEWSQMFATVEDRNQNRRELFKVVSRGSDTIGLEEWILYSFDHIREKVSGMDMKAVNWNCLEAMGKEPFLDFCRAAVDDRASSEYKELYTFLFKAFVEADSDQKGKVTLQQFDVLVEKAAAAPRSLGLAPSSAEMFQSDGQRIASRQQLFQKMDVARNGVITFDEFLKYTVDHIAEKVRSSATETVAKEAQASVRGIGLRPWQVEKGAFKRWVRSAINYPNGSERRELYDFLCECFMDADSDKDGMVKIEEFDFLVEKAATLPRRFGLAPMWHEQYSDVQQRQVGRQELFRQMDADGSGAIGLEEWINYSLDHIAKKVRTMNSTTVDFKNLAATGVNRFLEFLQNAIHNKNSEESKELYSFLYKNFVEADTDQKGTITLEQFDLLVEKSASAPRQLGLAPSSASMYDSDAARIEARRQLFKQMDADNNGTITFEEYLNYTTAHIEEKLGNAGPVSWGN